MVFFKERVYHHSSEYERNIIDRSGGLSLYPSVGDKIIGKQNSVISWNEKEHSLVTSYNNIGYIYSASIYYCIFLYFSSTKHTITSELSSNLRKLKKNHKNST